MKSILHIVRGVAFVAALLFSTHASSIAFFSKGPGYITPETISLAPDGFGTLGGNYFIPDAGAGLGQIWTVPATGGAPTAFLPVPLTDMPRGGLFLPAGWGADTGNFLAVSQLVRVFDGSGNVTATFTTIDSGNVITAAGNFSTPVIAPASFVPYGGHLFVSDQNNRIWQASPGTSELTLFKYFQADGPPFDALSPFGLAFTPTSFGSFGNSLLVDDSIAITNADGSRFSPIVAVTASGTSSVFAEVSLKDNADGTPGQFGLRQMVVTPNDFFLPTLGIPGQLLLVSVSASNQGGGILGDVLANDAFGHLVASLRDDLGLTNFDPRGLYFTPDGELLISDTSKTDPIYIASASDFRIAGTPEPATVVLLALGLAGLGFGRRRRA